MIKIRYNDSGSMINAEFSVVSTHVCYIIGDTTINTSGFTIYDEDGKTILGDWSDYSTVYRLLDNGIQYSNDGSVYIEPAEDIEISISFENVPNIPSSLQVDLMNSNDELLQVRVYKNKGWKLVLTNMPIAENWHIVGSEYIEDCHSSTTNFHITYSENELTWIDKIEAQVMWTALVTDTLLEEEE